MYGEYQQSSGSVSTDTPREVYSADKIDAYLSSICFTEAYRSSPLFGSPKLARVKENGLSFLQALMRFQLAKVPFENLELHYSPSREISLDADSLFEKFVESGSNRGGHCLQLNTFFAIVLRSLGFEVTTSAARVNTDCQAVATKPGYRGSSYNGWDHMILMVTLSSERYLVDVGMNAKGPMVPIPMIHDPQPIVSVAPRTVRLIQDFLPESTSRDPAHRYWQLEQRYSEQQAWTSVYAFAEVEFIPPDFHVMNWYINTHPTSWFTQQIMIGKMILTEDKKEIIGDLTLHKNVLQRRVRGRIELKVECRSEDERVLALSRHFDIHLNGRQRRGILNTVSEIP
ncbi:MAG: hypothetical protein Q9165_006276 [Trypethelium subeluteriae]